MFQFPPIPSWDAWHPMIIHFPIALLLIAPVFILLGALLAPGRGRPYLMAAMALLLLGTAGTFVAVETGEAAAQIADRAPGVEQVIETHESLAERTRAVFSVLSVIFLALLAGPQFLNRTDSRLTTTILPLAFLILYSAGILLLVNTAHNGGRLVHEYGVTAMVSSPAADTNAAVPLETEHEKD
ncbi:MAG TPA: DUF2231 domain-containing protein [Candidatus Sulfotelmatobacter sp.]|nr:DUF2231 domain-containing protein [Candidatus Sulfotelmatobacter sp.]